MKKIAFLLGLLNLHSYGASISWGSANIAAATSDISTNGTLVEAVNLGGSGTGGVTNQTVNGVLFTAETNLLDKNATFDAYTGSTGDASYDALLKSVDYGGGTNTVTLSVGNGSLVSGSSYEIQVWYSDTRQSPVRVTPVGDGNGNSVSIDSSGQFATGTFTADGSSQTITLESPGFGQAHLNAYQIRAINAGLTATLSTPSPTVSGAFIVTATFSEDITGLTESDFSVTNGSLDTATLSGSGSVYTFSVTPTGSGNTTVILAANSVTDIDGDNDQNTNPSSLSVAFSTNQPTVELVDYVECVSAPYEVTAHFSRQVSGLTASDFTLTNATITNIVDNSILDTSNADNANYTITVAPTAEGTVTVTLPSNTVTANDDSLVNLGSNTLTTEYSLHPKATIYGATTSGSREVEVFFTFSPYISGFTTSDIQVTNGTVTSLTMQGRREFAERFYKATVNALTPGNVTITVPQGSVTNLNAPAYSNTISNTFTVVVGDDFGDRWIVDTDADWAMHENTSSNMTLSNGYAEPSANTSTFSSTLKTYTAPKKATNVTFTQSPVWDNWTEIGDVEPNGATNALVLLCVAEDEYYLFGRDGSNDYYSAWQSSDMNNWTKLGQVTEDGDRWVTTVEYKNGTFYILVDTPNDHTPTLYTDNNLADGVPGTNHGIIFYDPTDGSDSAFFRDNADDRFHIISEDWSPIDASQHSWDSPLATHASSPDAVSGFIAGQHLPPIDFRTTPTGTIGEYDHPSLRNEETIRSNPQRYEIHSGDQDAFGDWTSIKVGGRYYLFGDFEQHNGAVQINVGRLVSDSIYGEFQLMGNMGDGHPDPTCGFAEGQFYLMTQQNNLDFVSPGPWVDGVEARAGVDTNNDGAIDQWTGWQTVAESYDHTPGYARVVTTTPAGIDLSSLPIGYGFQFEFRVDNTVVTNVSPIMDRVEMSFEPSNFQQWANIANTPASLTGDHNNNGIPNLVEFALGECPFPAIAADNSLTFNLSSGAVADGISMDLNFSLDLDTWTDANATTAGISLLNVNPQSGGDIDYIFNVDQSSNTKLFWRPAITKP